MYFDESKKDLSPQELSINIPSDNEVMTIAQNFIENLNLLPKNFRIAGVAPIIFLIGETEPSRCKLLTGNKYSLKIIIYFFS